MDLCYACGINPHPINPKRVRTKFFCTDCTNALSSDDLASFWRGWRDAHEELERLRSGAMYEAGFRRGFQSRFAERFPKLPAYQLAPSKFEPRPTESI